MNLILRITLLALCAFFNPYTLSASSKLCKYQNPIIKGFHPDPSICRVGDDYYLICSSFEWFPGIPIYHSKDLVNWEQIGSVLSRPSQLKMKPGMKNSAGIWAPTIRYHQGKFYVICTAQQAGGNFYVTSDYPEGPYSDPVFIKNAPGIDPSLFFDHDGTCWYTGSINGRPNEDKYKNEDKIYLQQLDLKSGLLIGERHILTSGNAINSPFVEAPHIYKIDNRYMLMVAEGGTWTNHAVTVFFSDKITGPYVPSYINPVLTNRHLGNNYSITSIGHADLVQTSQGDWWSVMLGVRPINGLNLLGRETFLTPVTFEAGNPIFNKGFGKVTMTGKAPELPFSPVASVPERDDFTTPNLGLVWSMLRTPYSKWYNINGGMLNINLRPETIKEFVNPSLIARRIQDPYFVVETSIEFKAKNDYEEAGLVMMQNDRFSYRLTKSKEQIKLYVVNKGIESLIQTIKYTNNVATIGVKSYGDQYQFLLNGEPFAPLQNAKICSSNYAGGFIGPFIGMYASSNGHASKQSASFDWFSYKPMLEIDPLPMLQTGVFKTEDIAIRDPYILTDNQNKCYYLYGATRLESDKPNGREGVKMYRSTDLKNWTGPFLVYETSDESWADPKHGVWAPEVHVYKDKYYLFATLTNEKTVLEVQPNRPKIHARGTQVFVSDTPYGPFKAMANCPHTPQNYMALDGTLWVEDGIPYMVFCHEWIQTIDGGMVYARMSDDLSALNGPICHMFKAKDASWVRTIPQYKGKPMEGYITDGCFLRKLPSGTLMMIWSSFSDNGYTVACAYSKSGMLAGPWEHHDDLVFSSNGGHGMIFESLEGDLLLPLHHPNTNLFPKCKIFKIEETDLGVKII